MERTQSISTFGTSQNRPMVHLDYPLLVILLSSIIMTPPAHADQGWGFGLKVGSQTADHPISGNQSTRTRFEAELASPMFADNHMDLAFSFGGASVASYSYESPITYYDDGWSQNTEKDSVVAMDIRLAARLYPFGRNYDDYYKPFKISPYVGAGFGYFWVVDFFKGTQIDAWEDPFDPGFYDIVETKDDYTETFANGFFPFLLAGCNVSVTSQCDVLVELQYDFGKKNNGIDRGGHIIMVGGRVRW